MEFSCVRSSYAASSGVLTIRSKSVFMPSDTARASLGRDRQGRTGPCEICDRLLGRFAIVVGVGEDHWDPLEVVERHRRRRLPLETKRVPRVRRGTLRLNEDRPDEVSDKDEERTP